MKYILRKNIDAEISINNILKRLNNDTVTAILQKRQRWPFMVVIIGLILYIWKQINLQCNGA